MHVLSFGSRYEIRGVLGVQLGKRTNSFLESDGQPYPGNERRGRRRANLQAQPFIHLRRCGGGYVSVGGPGFPPPAAIPPPSPAVPAALPPSPVSGAPVHVYVASGAGVTAGAQQYMDFASAQQ